jgi:uncharacterized DUF497 family protein
MPQIKYDLQKNQSNLEKHGIALAQAHWLDWDTLWFKKDERHSDQEVRYQGYAVMNHRLYGVVFTIREDHYRIISLRKANQREIAIYEKETDYPNS